MTSFKLGDALFVKHVGSTTIFVRSNISQTSNFSKRNIKIAVRPPKYISVIFYLNIKT
jgi:hypothetical protein